MTSTVELHGYLAERDVPIDFDRNWLTTSVLTPLGIAPDQHFADVCEDILLSATADSPGELHVRPGGWRINLSASLARATIAAAIVGAGLMTVGADQVPLQLLPAVLPLLVDVDRVRLSREDRELLIPLRHAAVGVEEMALHPEVLYSRLDPAVQTQLNYRDYLAFIQRLIELGELDDAGGGDVRARRPGERAWLRITWG